MNNVIGYVCVFMSFIIICTFCGGLFGIAAGGTFTDSLTRFGSTLNSVKHGLIDPLNDFLSFFGLSPSYGGAALVYRFDQELDSDYSDLFPEDAYYCSSHMSPMDITFGYELKYFYFIFFDIDGNPLEAKVFKYSTFELVSPGISTYLSIDCSRCYYNPYSKFLYADFDIHVYNALYERNDVVNIFLNSSLVDYKYCGNFSDLYRKICPGLGGYF